MNTSMHSDLNASSSSAPYSRQRILPEELERQDGDESPAAAKLERVLTIGFRTLTHVHTNTLRNTATVIDPNANVHLIPLPELAVRFSTHLEHGLSAVEASKRLVRNGPNKISPPRKDWGKKVFEYLCGGFCWLLWIAAIVTFLSWEPLGEPNPSVSNLSLAVLLLVVIVLQASFTAYQDYTASNIMASINSMLPQNTIAIRDGSRKQVPVAGLVVGDLVCVKYGNAMPADVRYVECSALKVDRSILTGESAPIAGSVESTSDDVHETKNIGLMGTYVTEGECIGVVHAVGDNSMMGKVAALTNRTGSRKTILQLEIDRFVRIIAVLAISTGLLCMLIWGVWLSKQYPNFLSLSAMLSTDMGIIVAYVPEGLPIAVTLVLSILASRMRLQRILVKSLTTVETLGCVNVICSDKTGTLTTNRMVVNSIWAWDTPLRLPIDGQSSASSHAVKELTSISHLCNGSTFDDADAALPAAVRRVNGDSTDAALLRFAETAASVADEKRCFTRVCQVPFDSQAKRMVSLFTPRDPQTNIFAYGTLDPALLVKGAPDYLMPLCTHVLHSAPTGTYTTDLTPEVLARIKEVQEQWANEGERVVLLAKRILRPSDIQDGQAEVNALVTNLCVVGLVGIVDPPRVEINNVIRQCRQAGIRVNMVTGDFPTTAAAIARKIGLFTQETTHTISDLPAANVVGKPVLASLLLTGTDIAILTQAQWDVVCSYPEIAFARTTPSQKLLIVQHFQARKHIVAVTGDGVNDAPALKNANIGVAMGSGSDVAIEAAAMVLLDSNFSSMIVATRQGRVVFENLKKVCIYLLPAGSFSELTPVLATLFLGVPVPLSTFLMIIVCVLTDMSPSMALMYEEAEGDLLMRPPRRVGVDRLVDWRLLFQAYVLVGIYETLVSHGMYCAYFYFEWHFPIRSLLFAFDHWTNNGVYAGLSLDDRNTSAASAQCVYFVTLVILQFFNLLGCRTRRLSIFQQSPFRNWRLFLAMLTSLCIALAVVYLPFLQTWFGTQPIPAVWWFTPIPFGIVLLSLEEARKWDVRSRPNGCLANIAW